MRAAIDAKDVGAFSSYVNFPAVQDSIQSQLAASMRKKLGGAGRPRTICSPTSAWLSARASSTRWWTHWCRPRV
ncbi:DUF2939 domain-containing protein [Ralstonia solanacearum]